MLMTASVRRSEESRAPVTAVSARLSRSDLLLLLVPSAWVSLAVIARNPVGIPHVERMLFISVCLWAVAACVAQLLCANGYDRNLVVNTTFVALIVLVTGGAVLRQSGPVVGSVLLAAVLILTALVSHRLKASSAPKVIVVAMAVALISGPVIDAFQSALEFRSSELTTHAELMVALEDTPDVYLVVLDGFPSIDTMNQTMESNRGSALAERLRADGFSVPSTVNAAYPATDYSVPSILEMDYPLVRERNNDATLQALYAVIGGDNRVRDVFESNGYETTMVESGWSGSSCQGLYDRCIASKWYDDPMSQMVRSTILDPLLVPGTAYQYAVGSSWTMDWLRNNLRALSQDSKPDYVFAHVVAPHAPMFLSEDCSVVPDARREGYFFRHPGVGDDLRSQFMSGQIECLTRFMLEVNESIDDDAIVVFTSDHGTDRHDQTARDPSSWSPDEYSERMSSFVAANVGIECRLGDDFGLPNLMRRVISCLTREPLPDVASKTYLFNRDWRDA